MQRCSAALLRGALFCSLLTGPRFELVWRSATKWRHRVLDEAGARAVRLKVLLAAVLGQAGIDYLPYIDHYICS